MKRKATTKGTRTDVYQEVTDRMIRALEAGVVPWRKPWTSAGRPRSLSTGRPYRGINVWLLSLAGQDNGWTSPWFGTYGQIQERGGQVRKGEKSTLVTFWKALEKEDRDPATGEVSTTTVPMLRQFRVFSACQADGLPERYFPAPGTQAEPIAGPQAVLDGYVNRPGGPTLHYDVAGQAYYSPAEDEIHMPPLAGHRSAEDFYSTAFHEAGHSTGHKSRLAREGVRGTGKFGSHAYGKEELAAEMTASMLCAETGVDTDAIFANSAAYVGSWLETIKADPKMVISAAAAGQKAADLVLEPTREALADLEPPALDDYNVAVNGHLVAETPADVEHEAA
jgi:antirestriction protein ArdC